MCIAVGGRAKDSRQVDGLRIVGTESEVAAQVEAQVHMCTGVGGQVTDRGHGKRSGSAGRGTSACVHRCGWVGLRYQV